jgi:hypothetical protein
MNTLDDLRRTLDQHAADVADPATVVRTAAVHHRVAATRRRRRTLGTGALTLALLAGTVTALWPRTDGHVLPAAPVVLGQQAPTTIRSLGYTYRTDGTGVSGAAMATLRVARSEQPQLYSWTSDGPSAVRLRLPDGEIWHSRLPGFHDFVVLPVGTEGVLRAYTHDGHVALARYTLTAERPDGYTRGGITYRQVAEGHQLLGAVVGDPGVADASTTIRVATGEQVQLAPFCSGLPDGYAVHVTLDGRSSIGGGCSDPTFDPGGSGGYVTKLRSTSGEVTVRIFVTRGIRSTTPVRSGELPGLRMGVGVYGPFEQTPVSGNQIEPVIEQLGHTWNLQGIRTSPHGALRIPAVGRDRVAWMVWSAEGTVHPFFDADGMEPQAGMFAGGPAGIGDLWVPAGSEVRARLAHDKGPFSVALYGRSD